jgi:hypothetical protein
MLSLLLTALPVLAVDYLFSATSNSFPTSCSYVSEGNYTCANLTLVAGDTVTIDPNSPVTPATINVVGTFVTADATVNIDGLASDLNIVMVSTVEITNSQINANVSSIAALNVYASSVIGGNLSASTPTGIVYLATNTTMVGDVHTDAGAITLGSGSHVGGNLFSTGAGVLSLGSNIILGGSISSFDGAISIGIGTQIVGGVSSSGGGVLTLGSDVTVGLDVVSAVGAITVGNGSSISGDLGSTGAGVVTVGANIAVGGDIFTVAGAITIGDSSTVGGDVGSTGAGVVTLSTSVFVGGDISTTSGAITIGAGTTVVGDVAATGAGVVTVATNVVVGGSITTAVGAINVGDSSSVCGDVDSTGAGVTTLNTTVSVGGEVTSSGVIVIGAGSTTSGPCNLLFPPDILILKSVQIYSDPVNLQDNPKAIPGSVILYTILVTNQGSGATSPDTVVLTDPMPTNTEVFVGDINGTGSGPLLFTDGTSASGLSYSINSLASTTDNISFSNDNGATFVYTPIPSSDGYDSTVTDIKVALSGALKASSGAPHPSFSISFRTRLK